MVDRVVVPAEGRTVTDWLVPVGFLLGVLVLGMCSLLGWCADTRDPEFSVGRVIAPRPDRD